jgi:histidinol-phosphate/aromatic aminotransferase/cobyric acid decarboxylase-like protein
LPTEANVNAAQTSGLQQAAAHRREVATSRDQLNEQWERLNEQCERAGQLDPSGDIGNS